MVMICTSSSWRRHRAAREALERLAQAAEIGERTVGFERLQLSR